jgi:glycine dehydrogenase subunit 1
MLAKIGVDGIDALFANISRDKCLTGLIDLPRSKGELDVERELSRMAVRNVWRMPGRRFTILDRS